MKIVLLTAHFRNGEPQHRFVAHKLAEAFPDELQAIIVATGVQRSPWQKVRRLWKRYSLAQIASRALIKLEHNLRRRGSRKEAVFERILFPHGGGELMPREDILIEVPAHNSTACKEILDRIKPDIIVTYGTLIIRSDLIRRARISMINMHTGISPVYRGSDTIFWPLYFEEPQWVGATIHRVDPGIDSGDVLHTVRPQIAADDDADTLFAKAVRAGTPYLIQAVGEEFEGVSKPERQDLSQGREFKSVQRTLTAERRVRSLLREGLLQRYGDLT